MLSDSQCMGFFLFSPRLCCKPIIQPSCSIPKPLSVLGRLWILFVLVILIVNVCLRLLCSLEAMQRSQHIASCDAARNKALEGKLWWHATVSWQVCCISIGTCCGSTTTSISNFQGFQTVLLGNRSCLVMSGPFPAAHAAAKGYALVTIYGPWRCGMRHRVTLETS
jgi:hypothetical protein